MKVCNSNDCLEINENKAVETVVETVIESVVEEPNGETDIYEAQGYVAIPMEESDHEEEGEDGYFDKGYMTLPDEDPDEDKRTIEYPENYEEIAGRKWIQNVICRYTT